MNIPDPLAPAKDLFDQFYFKLQLLQTENPGKNIEVLLALGSALYPIQTVTYEKPNMLILESVDSENSKLIFYLQSHQVKLVYKLYTPEPNKPKKTIGFIDPEK